LLNDIVWFEQTLTSIQALFKGRNRHEIEHSSK
jgi:hypothetical protein